MKGTVATYVGRRLMVVLPVMCLMMASINGLYIQPENWWQSTPLRALANILPILVIIMVDTLRPIAAGWKHIVLRSLFYMYSYTVLLLTVLYIPVGELVSILNNWHTYDWRNVIDHHLHSGYGWNITLFKKFDIYTWTDRQVIGNFIMLLPLGMFLPLLYHTMRGSGQVTLVAFFVSLCIESFQFVFTVLFSVSNVYYFRSFDVDDLFLNTSGAIVGYILWRTGYVIFHLLQRGKSIE